MQLPRRLFKRVPDTHKGDYGHVLVVGGSPGLSGAVCLAADSTLRAGAGLVTVGGPRSLNMIFEVKLTEVMSLPLAETADGSLSLKAYDLLKKFFAKIDGLVCGCGASRNISTAKLIRRLVSEFPGFIVLDADGINALAGDIAVLEKRKTNALILTPHEGEFARLIKKTAETVHARRKELAKKFALRYNLTLVLKGNNTIVTDGKRIFENTTGNAGMATAGSGDVLAGIISGIAAQKLAAFEAACAGVYLHGLAGDLAARDLTQMAVIASDLIYYLPQALMTMRRRSSIGRAGVL